MENLPIDIVLVRHGESEGNLAQAQSKKGDDRQEIIIIINFHQKGNVNFDSLIFEFPSLWTPDFSARHTSMYRLTDKGRKQVCINELIAFSLANCINFSITGSNCRRVDKKQFSGYF